MKFNIYRDFINNSKILCITGTANCGKSILALKIVEALNQNTYYFDTDNGIKDYNKKIFICHEFSYNRILVAIEDIIKISKNNKAIIVIDSISNIRFDDGYMKSYYIKKFINILSKLQESKNVKFILISNQYSNITNNIKDLKNTVEDSLLNMIYLKNYDEILNLNLKRDLLTLKLKHILK